MFLFCFVFLQRIIMSILQALWHMSPTTSGSQMFYLQRITLRVHKWNQMDSYRSLSESQTCCGHSRLALDAFLLILLSTHLFMKGVKLWNKCDNELKECTNMGKYKKFSKQKLQIAI